MIQAQSNNRDHHSEIAKSLTTLEREMAAEHHLMRVVGKRGHHVPVLIPRDAMEAMEVLVTFRQGTKQIFVTLVSTVKFFLDI